MCHSPECGLSWWMFMRAGEKCASFCCWMKLSLYGNYTQLSSAVSFLILCLLDMSISKRGVLKLSIMIMGLSISPYSSISQFDALLLGPYLLKLLCFLGNWLLYHHVKPFFIPDDYPCSGVCFVCNYVVIPCFPVLELVDFSPSICF